MNLRIDHAQPDDAPVIAQMVGELLREIMAMVETKVFEFHQEGTEARARCWITNGKYSVLLARNGVQPEPPGPLALSESYALYSERVYGTIPEFYVRRRIDRKGSGRPCSWKRMELGD